MENLDSWKAWNSGVKLKMGILEVGVLEIRTFVRYHNMCKYPTAYSLPYNMCSFTDMQSAWLCLDLVDLDENDFVQEIGHLDLVQTLILSSMAVRKTTLAGSTHGQTVGKCSGWEISQCVSSVDPCISTLHELTRMISTVCAQQDCR